MLHDVSDPRIARRAWGLQRMIYSFHFAVFVSVLAACNNETPPAALKSDGSKNAAQRAIEHTFFDNDRIHVTLRDKPNNLSLN